MKRRGTARLAEIAACQLTPEKRPFLSSYVLMSVRRSKFEYILTLGWKYKGSLLDCAIKIGQDMLCSSNGVGFRLWIWLTGYFPVRALKQKQYELMEAAVNFSLMPILKETEQMQNGEMNDDSTHSACSPILTAFNRNLCICRSFNTFSWKLWKLL